MSIKVNLRFVGLYADIPNVEVKEDASVLDVLTAARDGQFANNPDLLYFDFKPAALVTAIGQRFGTGVERLKVQFKPNATIQTRKNYQDNSQRSPIPYDREGIFEISDNLDPAEFERRVDAGEPIPAIQYYVFEKSTDGSDLGELISDDGTIVASSNTGSEYPLKNGSTIVFRLLGILFSPSGALPDSRSSGFSGKALIAAMREGVSMDALREASK